MQHWLWVHFGINSGIIGAAFKAGSAQKLSNSIPLLRLGILAGREALKSGEALGVPMPHFKSLKPYVDNPPVLHSA
jgi:hypothetical protein